MTITGNRLLDCAPEEARMVLLAEARKVQVPTGYALSKAHKVPQSVFFPTGTIAAQMVTTPEGEAVGVGLLGLEDVANCFALLGHRTSSATCVALVAGSSYCIPLERMRDLFESEPAVRDLILDHLQYQLAVHDQISACNRLHDIEQRLALWLLSLADQLRTDSYAMTQITLSKILGVQRSSLSLAASSLKDSGLIEYRRGQVWIENREALTARACSCYVVTQRLVRQLHDSASMDAANPYAAVAAEV